MTPRATYRLQFHKDFGFLAAARVAPYLARLGISHIYASPWLKARPGSLHGYDIVDHHSLNPELGTRADFDTMVAAFRANGLRQILDFVPNHMGVGGADNPLWLDALEWGPDSQYAGWFDIEWRSDRFCQLDKLLVPFLGDQYGAELYSGKLALKFDEQDGSFAVWAYDWHKLPVCPLHYGRILGDAHPDLERFGDAFASLPEWRPQVGRRARELKDALARAARENPEISKAIGDALAPFHGTPGDPQSWRGLHALVQDQFWRAADFRVAADDINYRRFFNINDLAGMRMELADVFDHAHRLAFELLDQGVLDGLRIDHVDGLLNPKEYFDRLRAHGSPGGEPTYLVVEKILAHHESLREDWPVDGTTGYEFTNLVLGLLVDPAGEEATTRAYAEFTGRNESFTEVVHDSKLRILHYEMASELEMLSRQAARVARLSPLTADFTHNVLRRAIREVVACFPVYRTYIDASGEPSDDDRRYLNWAMSQARVNESDIDPRVFDFIETLLSGDVLREAHKGFSRHAVLRCAMKLQQLSGPVMAKGLEDTAFFRYYRFLALNEVGGHPERFGITLTAFHKANAQRARRWPKSMLATSTHDTKRGEDARARLAVLSEIPAEWAAQAALWSRLVRARRGDIEAAGAPDRNDEYMFFQTLVGSWPAELIGKPVLDTTMLAPYVERLKVAMIKSIREAKLHSHWARPNIEYEDAVTSFVEWALDPERSSAFHAAFLPFVERIARLGVENSLVQTVLKLTAPGVPDIYQGADLWDFSLMDPDNRRPVDFDLRARMLESLESSAPPISQLLRCWPDGAIKLMVTERILRHRRDHPALFAGGDYEPVTANGPKGDRICAFERRSAEQRILVAVARFPARREADPDWSQTTIPANPDVNAWYNLLTGVALAATGELPAEEVFRDLPVALLAPA